LPFCGKRATVGFRTGALLAAGEQFLYFVLGAMGDLGRLLGWVGACLAVAIAGMTTAFFLIRRRIVERVRVDLGTTNLLLATTARVGENGKVHDGETASHHSATGILMLLSSGLYFHSWIGEREVFVPGSSISWIGVSDARAVPRNERHRIVVRFLNASGKEDGISIRLLYPGQWVDAIKTHLITRAS
jgi:hypothetical protein